MMSRAAEELYSSHRFLDAQWTATRLAWRDQSAADFESNHWAALESEATEIERDGLRIIELLEQARAATER